MSEVKPLSFEQIRAYALAAIRMRIANGEFTERGLARQARLSQSAVHNILAGNRIGTVDTLDRLCRAANIKGQLQIL